MANVVFEGNPRKDVFTFSDVDIGQFFIYCNKLYIKSEEETALDCSDECEVDFGSTSALVFPAKVDIYFDYLYNGEDD